MCRPVSEFPPPSAARACSPPVLGDSSAPAQSPASFLSGGYGRRASLGSHLPTACCLSEAGPHPPRAWRRAGRLSPPPSAALLASGLQPGSSSVRLQLYTIFPFPLSGHVSPFLAPPPFASGPKLLSICPSYSRRVNQPLGTRGRVSSSTPVGWPAAPGGLQMRGLGCLSAPEFKTT